MTRDKSRRTKKMHDKKSCEIIIHDRSDLTDYERDQLIPEIKSRLVALRNYFQEVIHICDIQIGQPHFIENLNSIINPDGIPEYTESLKDSIADKFYSDIKDHAQKKNIYYINRALESYKEIDDTKTLGLFMNEVNILCSSFLISKNTILLYKIQGYAFVTNVETGEVTAKQPAQYFVTTEPFQLIIDNIIAVAKSTSNAVNDWHAYTTKLKTQYLDLYTNRLAIDNTKKVLYIQLLTILLAISLSAYFLLANDPFTLFKKNLALNKEVVQLKEERAELEKEIELLNKKIKSNKRMHSNADQR